MKVLRIVSELDFGGVEKVVLNSIPSLFNIDNNEVKVIVLGRGGIVSERLQELGVPVEVLNKNNRIPNFYLINYLIKLFKIEEPDVVHTQGAEANFHGLIAAKIAGVPVRIGEEIGFPNHHSYWKYIFREVYKNATKVIAISQAVKDRIVELGEVEAEKVEVVYNPVEIREREKDKGERGNIEKISISGEEEQGLSGTYKVEETLRYTQSDVYNGEIEKPFVFVTTCRLVPVKNLDRLISAFGKLCNKFSEKSIELWIVGDGPLRDSLENQSKELGVSDKVKFWEFQENVFPFLEKADSFVLPSLSEGSSVSLVEAMSVGLPSVVTKVGGALEIIGESQSAFIIDPLDENSIFKALYDCLSLSKNQRTVLGERAIMESKRFSVENYLKKILNIYVNQIS